MSRESTFRYWVGGTITALWAVSVAVDLFNPNYDPPPGLHPLMLTVAGGLFGREVVSAARRKDTEG